MKFRLPVMSVKQCPCLKDHMSICEGSIYCKLSSNLNVEFFFFFFSDGWIPAHGKETQHLRQKKN